MIVIYDVEETIITEDGESARNELIRVYGEKLGKQAYEVVKDSKPGMHFRANGGPLVSVVSEEDAEWIWEKEREIGMIKEE